MGARDAGSAETEAVLARAEAAALEEGLDPALVRAELAGVVALARRTARRLDKVVAISDAYQDQLKSARSDVRKLQELLLPICMFCKRVRADDEYWHRIETYFAQHAAVKFSHGICPTCMEERFAAAPAAADAAPGDAAAPPSPPAPAPPMETARPDEDLVGELRRLCEHPALRGTEVEGPLVKAVRRCERSFARYRKALDISDGYQTEFQARLEAAARFDGLTGLANRRALVDALALETQRPDRTPGPWLLLVDVDGMGAFNDRWGQELGDRALIALARAFRRQCWQARTRARWGGDAFAALVIDSRERVADQLNGMVEAARSLGLRQGQEEARVTVTCAAAPLDGLGAVDRWIRAAEVALGAAKAAGRDRAVVAAAAP